VSEAAPSPRSEPLLWLQLLALGLLPLEALLLLLLLGASDPGPLPLLERLLCWAIGVLAPAVLLWRLPADPWSLLVAQVPLRGRRPIQQRLSALQPPLLLRLGTLVGVGILSLLMLWWCDDHAAFASAFSPVAESPRLVGLLLAAALLALVQWQGQQVVQALWLLSRSPEDVAAVAPTSVAALERAMRLSPGLPLLLLPPLRKSIDPIVSSVRDADPPLRKPEPLLEAAAEAEKAAEDEAELAAPDQPSAAALDPSAPDPQDLPEGFANPSAVAAVIAVEPEQPTEEQQGSALDQQIR
jgi:hypothetical protein